ncbi:hypothetical protein JYU34_000787 [Plutella xylostella]|uniref:Uncharacterized protein n=1 Tax=Plutella xylostella TaxID=51655 RepID=A0ABQ7R8L9_PLUXY|nr:hypothetical protein JYU34_000787 [Plutella xylostella]
MVTRFNKNRFPLDVSVSQVNAAPPPPPPRRPPAAAVNQGKKETWPALPDDAKPPIPTSIVMGPWD